MTTPQQYVQNKAAASGSSFYYAFLFLPKDRRAAITAFYAFCREVDDVVDEVSDPGVAATKLAWWQSEVRKSFAGQPSHPVMQALMPHASAFSIQAEHLLAVIEGCQMDLEQTRYLDFPGLQRYCHLVAGVVGEVAARIFGQTSPQTTQYAHKLGLAFQLTNIIRDVGEDAMRGRIYLPVNELQQFDVKAHEILNRKYSDRFEALMRWERPGIGPVRPDVFIAEAEAALGDKFDLRGFHDTALSAGAMPISVLESVIDRWTAAHRHPPDQPACLRLSWYEVS